MAAYIDAGELNKYNIIILLKNNGYKICKVAREIFKNIFSRNFLLPDFCAQHFAQSDFNVFYFAKNQKPGKGRLLIVIKII